jgi:hypothetical protein
VFQLRDPYPDSGLDTFTDASLQAIGVLFDSFALHAEIKPDAWTDSFNIGSAEAFAVEIALSHLVKQGLRKTALRFHVDNMGVVDGWVSRRSRNAPTNASFIRMIQLCEDYELDLELLYIDTALNLADRVSRGDLTGLQVLSLPPLPKEVRAVLL